MMETGLILSLYPLIFSHIPTMLAISISHPHKLITITISPLKVTPIRILLLSEFLQDLAVLVFTALTTLKAHLLSSKVPNHLESIHSTGIKMLIYSSFKVQEKLDSPKELTDHIMMRLLPKFTIKLCKNSIKNSLNLKIKPCILLDNNMLVKLFQELHKLSLRKIEILIPQHG